MDASREMRMKRTYNPHFITTVLFEASGKETTIDWSAAFDTAEMRDIVIKAHKADEGQKQNFEKLGSYLSKLVSEPAEQ
jgi:hypothetical protein